MNLIRVISLFRTTTKAINSLIKKQVTKFNKLTVLISREKIHDKL